MVSFDSWMDSLVAIGYNQPMAKSVRPFCRRSTVYDQ